MRVLIMTAIYPTRENPAFGSFVRTQAESLKRAGIGVEVLVLKGRNRKLIYPKGVSQLRNLLKWGLFDLGHAGVETGQEISSLCSRSENSGEAISTGQDGCRLAWQEGPFH